MKRLPTALLVQAQSAARANPDAIVSVLDSEGVFLYVSASAKDILGFAPEDGIGHSFKDFYGELDAKHVELAIHDTLLNGRSVETTRMARMKDGGTRCMRGYAEKFTDPDTGDDYILSWSWPCQD